MFGDIAIPIFFRFERGSCGFDQPPAFSSRDDHRALLFCTACPTRQPSPAFRTYVAQRHRSVGPCPLTGEIMGSSFQSEGQNTGGR